MKKGTRFGLWLAILLTLGGVLGTVLQAEISEADKKKRDAFLKAREEMHTIAGPKPSASPEHKGKPKVATKKKKKKSEPNESAKRRAADEDDEEAAPRASKKKDLPTPAAKSKKPAADEDEETPRRVPPVRPSATPEEETRRARAVPTPNESLPPVPPSNVLADITIQKSGIEEEQGYEPPPAPPPRRSFWSRIFGRGDSTENFRYLSRSVIDAIRRAPVQRNRWKFIIVHNSGTRQGNARAFDYYHRHVRRMQNGLAYHFVVGNGTSSGNGEIEIGDRWRRQINGGHVHSDYLNNISLGICLVGDFNHERPTRMQLDATEELIKYLRERCGKADGRAIPVRPHREMNPPQWSTDCPGDAFPYSWFGRF